MLLMHKGMLLMHKGMLLVRKGMLLVRKGMFPIRFRYKRRKPSEIALEGFLLKKTAATYSPTGVQYHRRGRA